MDTLFNTKFEGEPTQHNQPGVQLKSNTYELQESNVRLKLTMVNTVGFGDQINKEDRWERHPSLSVLALAIWLVAKFTLK